MRPRSLTSTRLRALRAAVAALAVLLVAGGPIASVAHYLLVAHVVCEHGELVELTADPGATTPVLAQGSGPAVSAGDSALFAPDHVHCAVSAMARHAASGPAAGPRAHARLPATARLVTTPSAVSSHGCSILLLAPKTSPPLA